MVWKKYFHKRNRKNGGGKSEISVAPSANRTSRVSGLAFGNESAGQSFSKSSVFPGKPMVAHDATANRTRHQDVPDPCIVPPQRRDRHRVHERAVGIGMAFPLAFSSSAMVPMIRYLSHLSQTQTGIGMPQYRCREMHQSRALLIQS